jgi:hypothetical protein
MKQTVLTLPGGHEVVLNSVTSFPPGVMLISNTVGINAGEVSPPWVNELVKTKGGTKLLLRILVGLLAKEHINDICKEVEETTAKSDRGWSISFRS